MPSQTKNIIQEKLFVAEEKIGYVRLFIILLNSFVYHFLMEKSGTIPELAYTIIIVAISYALFVVFIKPYRKYNLFLTSIYTSTSDAVLITLFLWSTGKFASPFYPLWLVSVVAIAFRFSLKTTFVVAGIYILLDAGIVFFSQDFFVNTEVMTIRAGYILGVGLLSGFLSTEIISQIGDRIKLNQTEEKSRQALKMLQKAEAIANIGSWEWDISTDKVTWSDQLFRIYGLNPGQVDVTYKSFLQRAKEEDRDFIHSEIMSAFQASSSFEFYHRIVWDNREQRTLHCLGEVIVDKSGKPSKMRGTCQDVTDRKQLEEELQKSYGEMEQRVEERTKELQESNRDLEQFAFVVSHDLKTPLRAIHTLSGFIMEDYGEKMGVDGKMQLDMLKNSVVKMSELIDGILTYSRSGNDPKMEFIDLNALVNEAIAVVKPPSTIKISCVELPQIYYDKVQITQVFENLISNAVKHMDKPDGEIAINYQYCEGLKFSVSDNGPGVKPDEKEKIFQMFGTASNGNKKESTGIGLAIVKKIIEKAGGEIWVESQAGKGTTFYFTLPVKIRSAPNKIADSLKKKKKYQNIDNGGNSNLQTY